MENSKKESLAYETKNAAQLSVQAQQKREQHAERVLKKLTEHHVLLMQNVKAKSAQEVKHKKYVVFKDAEPPVQDQKIVIQQQQMDIVQMMELVEKKERDKYVFLIQIVHLPQILIAQQTKLVEKKG